MKTALKIGLASICAMPFFSYSMPIVTFHGTAMSSGPINGIVYIKETTVDGTIERKVPTDKAGNFQFDWDGESPVMLKIEGSMGGEYIEEYSHITTSLYQEHADLHINILPITSMYVAMSTGEKPDWVYENYAAKEPGTFQDEPNRLNYFFKHVWGFAPISAKSPM